MTVIFFSDIAWDSLHQRPQHIATRLAQRARILWVEPVTLGRRLMFTPQEQATDFYRMMLPAFPLNARKRWIRRLAVAMSRVRALRSVLSAAQRLLFTRGLRHVQQPGTATSCLVENFLFMHLTETLHPRRVVFDYIDDVFGFTSFPDFVRSEWLSAVQRADTVTVTSSTLRKRILDIYRRDVKLIPNGVDFEQFAHPVHHVRPADLPPDAAPIIGYVGSIYPWLDFALLDRTLEALPDFRFVMLGHLHPEVAGDMARLQRHMNFSFLGLKPYGEVPAYVRHFHVGIIPFRRTLLTEGVNPVKFYEYSAAGIPTVVTDFSDDTRAFADLVLIARTEQEFAQQIRVAVDRRSDSKFARRLLSFAEKNDWKNRAREFSDLLQLNGP